MKILLSVFLVFAAFSGFAFGEPVVDLDNRLVTAEYSNNLTQNSENYSMKIPELSALFSFVIPGAGHAYNGNWSKATGVFLSAVGSFFLTFASAFSGGSGTNLFGLYYLWNWLAFGVYDSYVDAEQINMRYKQKYGISSVQLSLSSI